MDFLDPAKKRAHRIRLFIGYMLVAIAIAMGSLILLFQSYGYDLDRKTGAVIQNGLVFLAAHPSSAAVYLDGKQQKNQTDTRLTLPAGQYQLELKRSGYHTWQHVLNLEGGSIERLVYPLLFPEKLITQDVQLYASAPTMASESLDRRWLMVQQPQSFTSFDVFDLAVASPQPETLTLPADLLTTASGAQSLSVVEWSSDNRHLLVKHTFSSGSEFIVIDRQTPAASVNLNKTLATNPTQITLRDKKPDQFYLYDEKTEALQVADLKTHQPTTLLNGILAFKSYGADTVLYAAALGDKVQLKLRDNDGSFVLRTLPVGTKYLLDITQYNGHWYMIASAQNEGRLNIYKDPQDIIKQPSPKPLAPITYLKIDQPQFVSFSQNAEFIMVQDGTKFGVYDIETDRRLYYELKLPVDVSQQANWMDGDRLSVNDGVHSVVFDFDGTNQRTLVSSQLATTPFFDRDYTALYTLGPSTVVPSRTALTRTPLVVK